MPGRIYAQEQGKVALSKSKGKKFVKELHSTLSEKAIMKAKPEKQSIRKKTR